ncbi:hypothetical protein [Peribacillus simplex]|uniref:hypothetical protein n=1 Tax=Peribacillus simplex TaxID=1478 RepID=UPI003D2D0493
MFEKALKVDVFPFNLSWHKNCLITLVNGLSVIFVESALNNWEALSKIIQFGLGKAGLDGKSEKIKNVGFRRLMFLVIGSEII